MFPSQDPNMRFEPNRFDRMNSPMGGNAYSYDMNQAQTWNPNAFSSNNHFSPNYAATTRQKPQARGRSALPNAWMDSQQMPAPMPYSGNMGHGSMPPSHRGSDQHDADDDLIPTAIVIKNIPFAVRKEQLVDLMTQMNLPLPYAFNYHFDNGVFRGLAFANFTSADETALVIEHLNHYELQGRKLRVEYKKMLPLQERERIEREKRERRGQLEEQHRTTGHGHQLQTQPSMSSMTSHTRPANTPSPVGMKMEMPDLNDPEVLQFYNQLLVFKEDTTREALIFPASLAPPQRRTVHTIAHHMSLYHNSRGTGEQRQVHVFKNSRPSPPIGTMSSMQAGDASRRGLNRAATMDVNEPRNGGEAGLINSSGIAPGPSFSALRGQHSSGLLDIPQSPGGGFASASVNLRSAKSVADLRSYTPSPAPSSASYSQNFPPGVPRFQDFGSGGGGAMTPSLASTGSGHTNTNMTGSGAFGTAASMSRTGTNDDGGLSNGFGGLSLRGSMSGGAHSGSASAGPHGPSGNNNNNSNSAAGSGESPRRIRGMFSWDNHQYHPLSNSTDLSGGTSNSGGNVVGSSSGPSPISANPASAGAIGSNRLNGTSAAVSFESLRQGASSGNSGNANTGGTGGSVSGVEKVGAPSRQPLGPSSSSSSSSAARQGQAQAQGGTANGTGSSKGKDAGVLSHVHARHGGSKGSASGGVSGGDVGMRGTRNGEVAVE